VINTAC